MSRRLLRLEVPVFPDGLTFRIRDPAAGLSGPAVPPPPAAGTLTSAARDQLIVACAQQHLGVQLTLEEWDDAPPPFSDGFEDDAKCELYLRGRLTIDCGPAGEPAVEGLALSGGVGGYALRLYARNRGRAVTGYAALYERFGDPLSDEFQQARRELAGTEQYLIQLWRES